jgi:hypothetical protein
MDRDVTVMIGGESGRYPVVGKGGCGASPVGRAGFSLPDGAQDMGNLSHAVEDRLSLLVAQQDRPERVARRYEPVRRFRVAQPIFPHDRLFEGRDRALPVPFAQEDLPFEHLSGDRE